jgi:hypothetical protein
VAAGRMKKERSPAMQEVWFREYLLFLLVFARMSGMFFFNPF